MIGIGPVATIFVVSIHLRGGKSVVGFFYRIRFIYLVLTFKLGSLFIDDTDLADK